MNESPIRRWIEEDVPADRLQVLDPEDNARRGDVDGVAGSIERFGFYGLIQAQAETGKIIVGNHRYLAGLQRGETTFDVQWNDIDDDTAVQMAIADNRHGDRSHFDLPVLTVQMARWGPEDFAGTGFTEDDLAAILEDLVVPPDVGLPASESDVRFLLATIEFFIAPETVIEWRAALEHVAGPREADQVAELRARLELHDT